MIAGKDAKRFGEAKNSWLTGTAAWTFTNISQYILGIRPEFDGLCIDPCIPDDMDASKLHAASETPHITLLLITQPIHKKVLNSL